MSLSVVLITKNAAPIVRRCLESVAWADEIVVLDSESSDETAPICREFTPQVEAVRDWRGFGPMKNRAVDQARGDWIFNIDADEWVTPALRAEMEAAMRNPGEAVAFRMPRRSSYCGRFMRHSGWSPDHVTRLFRRGRARFSEDRVHERLQVDGGVGTLTQPLLHESYRNLEQVLHKVNMYSTEGALTLHARGVRGSLGAAILHGGWAFLRTYVFRAGFLDGREGFMLGVSNAEATYYRYLKLLLLRRTKDADGSLPRDP